VFLGEVAVFSFSQLAFKAFVISAIVGICPVDVFWEAFTLLSVLFF
jgi:hypothetical protein